MYSMNLPEKTRQTKSSGSIRTYDHPPLILLLLLRQLAKLSKIKTANGTECLFVDHSGDAVDSPSPVPAPIHSALKYTEYTLTRVNPPFPALVLSSYRKRAFPSLEFLHVRLCRTSTAYIRRSYQFASFASRITDHIHIIDIEHCPIRGRGRVRTAPFVLLSAVWTLSEMHMSLLVFQRPPRFRFLTRALAY